MVLQRIEAALTRLEAAAAKHRLHEPPRDLAPELARSEASNARLREAVGLSLRQIDALIAHDAQDAPR